MKKILRILSFVLSLSLLLSAIAFPAIAAEPEQKNNTLNDVWMKIGCPRALDKEKKVLCDGEAPEAAPFLSEDGEVFFPLRVLASHIKGSMTLVGDHLTVSYQSGDLLAEFTLGETLASPVLKDGVVYVELSHAAKIFDYNSYYSEMMGVFALSSSGLKYKDTLDDQKLIYNLTKQFVFDFPSGDAFLSAVSRNVGLETHPRLAATQERFDYMRSVYLGKTEGDNVKDFREWIARFIAEAEQMFSGMFVDTGSGAAWISEEERLSHRAPYYCFDENGEIIMPDRDIDGLFTRGDIPDRYLNDPLREYVYDPDEKIATYTLYSDSMKTEIVYQSVAEFGDGYDAGARNNVAPAFARNLPYFALAWQMTGEQKWADAFWLVSEMLCTWPDWGEAHYLNAADTSQGVSLGLDWIWHAFDAEPQKREVIAEALYQRVVSPAYYQSFEYGRGNSGAANSRVAQHSRVARINPGGTFYFYRATNWNFVCTSGAVLACLAILEFEKYRTPEMIDDYECADTLTTVQWNLPNLANALVEYVPDGAYSEGPGYWGYATLSFYWMIAAMQTSGTGTYGLMNSIGLERTCNYIFNVGDSSGEVWAYHDCPKGSGATYCLFFASTYYNNPDFTTYRLSSIKAGNALNIMDVIFYDPAMFSADATVSKVYYMEASDVVTMRSGWEPTDVFTGLHGGPNSGDHTDADAGSFVLDMGGVRWIDDGGNENYNVGDYFGPTRFYYFRKSVEAHPTVFLISNNLSVSEHGQVLNTFNDSYAKLTRIEENEHGSIATVDLTPQFGGACTSAKRAVMITADGRTVVVQDEIKFADTESQYIWNLPIHTNGIEVTLSSDRKTAYLKAEGKTLRATILSENRKDLFSYLAEGADPILPGTISKNSSANTDSYGEEKYPLVSDTCQRLVIRGGTIRDNSLAVVFELIETGRETVCYSLVPIEKMNPIARSAYKADDPGPKPDEPFTDDSDVLPEDLLAAIEAMPDAEETEPIAFASELFQLYAMAEALNPENPDTGAAKFAFARYLSDVSDTVDAYNDIVSRVERARKKNVFLPSAMIC